MELYGQKLYKESAAEFDKLYKEYAFQLPNTELYNGACIYALNNENQKSLDILEYLVLFGGYTDLEHISKDTDLDNLHNYPKWKQIIDAIKANNLPIEERAAKELLKAKKILDDDGGKLWGEPIWNDNILVLTKDNTAYSLSYFENSTAAGTGAYSALLPANTLQYTNTTQHYGGKQYATIAENYLSDNSATIIHELFHILQFKHRMLNGQSVNYLDNTDAREWLRLEYQALRGCLNAINQNRGQQAVADYLQDAMIYRKKRQSKYSDFLAKEIEIETLEGLANYTGYVLSSYPNKYEIAVKEINKREQSDTYTRTFPYATGLAYGVIFDHLKMDWKQGLDSVYNFLHIYEKKYLKIPLTFTAKRETAADKRNNYVTIHEEETERKKLNDRKVLLLRRQLIESPVLSGELKDSNFGQSYDMNGMVVLDTHKIAYTTMFKGMDASQGKNFGSFTFQNADNEITGILITMTETSAVIVFPLPFRIEGNKIIGAAYEIILNENWAVQRKNEKGDYEIVEKKGAANNNQ